MKKLYAFYFSGTGNTRYVAQRLCEKLAGVYRAEVYDICGAPPPLPAEGEYSVLLAFPVYGSSPPVPMRRFVFRIASALRGREVIVVATQYMFSGDGAASLGRTVQKLGGRVRFAEHFDMPNNLSDCKLFAVKNGGALNDMLRRAERRMDRFASRIARGVPFRRGFNPLSHAVGYACQRKYWRRKENAKKSELKIDPRQCVGCGLCAARCPVKNIEVSQGCARPLGNCALCYRCVNLCPKKAIVLFGKGAPRTQYRGIAPREKS